LDELSKLLFAHVMLMSEGKDGISWNLVGDDSNAAVRLKTIVDTTVDRHLPVSLVHEIKPEEFHLRLRETEFELATEIARCFKWLNSSELVGSIRGRDSVDVLNDAFGQFIADSFVDEKELGQYLTPNEVVRFMVRLGLAALSETDRAALISADSQSSAGLILDPSCGVATFLTEALRLLYQEVRDSRGENEAAEWVDRAIRHNVVGVDKSERMLRLALTNLALFGTQEVNLHLCNALARSNGDGKRMEQFEGKAKLILTNPPFGATFHAADLAGFKLATAWTRRQPRTIDSELLFLERYLDWLAPGGHVIAVLPDSILTNRGVFEDLRNGLFPLVNVRAVISLPSVTFGVAGTSTKTSVVHLQKRESSREGREPTFFAVCKDVGYTVQTKGSARTKIARGQNGLERILHSALELVEGEDSRLVTLTPEVTRWDATYHAGMPAEVAERILKAETANLRFAEVGSLSSERINPLRLGAGQSFNYIEISDVDGATCSVRSKRIPCEEAPSRARKLVRAGDVLVSTVRPERRTVGVVPRELDGAVCSTGFAVLRAPGFSSLALAKVLQTDFVNAQLLRDNSGIAYPVIDEARLLHVVLPVNREQLSALSSLADPVLSAQEELDRLWRSLDAKVTEMVLSWAAE
jgi:type I restriction enzyme S subunit